MFELEETHRAVAQMLRQYCEREIEPQIAAIESGEVSPYDVMRTLADTFQMADMVARPLRKKVDRLRSGEPGKGTGGASGLGDPALNAVFAMELARVSPGLCLCVAANMGAGTTIAARGDADLIERCAIPVLTLQKVGCWALTEPGSGSDAFAMKTTLRIEGDTVVLDGSKTFISNAPAADVFLIYARHDSGDGADKRRIFPVVVERGTDGLTTGPAMDKLGMHASPTGEIFLDDVRVPRSHLLGDPEAPAREVAEETLASERAAVVAMCLGVIERCLDDCVRFAVDREQFGKPIGAFQLTQQTLARMYVARQNVKNLMLELVWMQKEGRASKRAVCAAKWYASEAACEVALDAIQLLGGAGYVRGLAPERLFRDIKLWTIGGGTSEIQQLNIAKDLLRERGLEIDLSGGFERI
jgi:hypothetical protein